MWNVLELSAGGEYTATPMTDLLLLLADLSSGAGAVPELVWMRGTRALNKFDIGDDLLAFCKGELPFTQLINRSLKCNADFQNHVMKGVIGLFL